ncbi:hypothetical protein ACHAPF_000206 [Botrytis cinerea]
MANPMDLRSLGNSLNSIAARSNNHKIIIGIDYGTTFSGIQIEPQGVSYVTSDKDGIEDITIMSPWPGDPHVSWKTPTRIAYSQENSSLKNNKWGFEVNPKMISYSWTKLLLDKNAATKEHDDPSLTGMEGSGMLPLPPFRDAAGVCEDFLREVYIHVSNKLRQQMSDLTFENTPMECWVTLPAVWSEEAKDATLNAAKNAGFGNRPGDEIYTIAEPEAAAIATLKEFAKSDAMNQITVQPYLSFDELCVGIGGKCGSTQIDRNLHIMLSQRFGAAFDDLTFGQKGPGSRFMAAFEALKRDFGRNDEREIGELGPLNLNVVDSAYFDEEDRLVLLSHQDMRALFDPVITEITRLVEQQVKAAKDTQNAKINRIILVGGFGESLYLNTKLKSWCKRNGNITLICPLHPQSAVVRGAALRGLEGIAPRVKHLRRHYGISLDKSFREGIDPEEDSYVDGDEITKDTFRVVDSGTEYTPHENKILKSTLYACVSEEPPEYLSDPGIERVGEIQSNLGKSFNFGNNIQTQFNHRLGRQVQRITFQQQIVFGNKGDNLTFKCLIGGKEICKSAMNFDR